MSDFKFLLLENKKLNVFRILETFVIFFVPRIHKLQYKVRIHSHIYQILLHLTFIKLTCTWQNIGNPKRYWIKKIITVLLFALFSLLCIHAHILPCTHIGLKRAWGVSSLSTSVVIRNQAQDIRLVCHALPLGHLIGPLQLLPWFSSSLQKDRLLA